jgi:predicted transposase/invertase (TIGR01784 family)
MERLNPLDDYIFMKTFGEKGNEEQLLAFLNAVLQRTGRDGLVSVEILEDKTFTGDTIGKKTGILDVRARTNKNDNVSIEVQLKDLHNMDRRSLFYWSKQYVKHLDAGENYNLLPNVIAINIVDFDYIKLDDFHTSFHLREDMTPNYQLTEAIEIHFINMTKFRKQKNKDIKNNALERWMMYLDDHTQSELIEEIIRMDTAIERTNERLAFLSQDEETMRRYERLQMERADWNSVIYERDQNARERDQNARERDKNARERDQEHAARVEEHAARVEAERRLAELEAQLQAK